jgi:hypothetical protein
VGQGHLLARNVFVNLPYFFSHATVFPATVAAGSDVQKSRPMKERKTNGKRAGIGEKRIPEKGQEALMSLSLNHFLRFGKPKTSPIFAEHI